MVSSALCSLLMKPVYTVICSQQWWDTLTEHRGHDFDHLDLRACMRACVLREFGKQLQEEATHDGIYHSHNQGIEEY